MKKFYTPLSRMDKTLLSFLFLITFSFCSKISTAQTLEEIPNPTDYSLSWFSGGEEGDLFFEYYDPNFYTGLFHYDGMDLNSIPFSGDLNFPFYSHEFNGNFYFTAYDANFYQILIEYDGVSNASEFDIPAGFQYGGYIGEYNSKMYLFLYDSNFNILLYEYDGTNLTEVSGPADLTFGNFVTIFSDVMYLAFYDSNFNYQMVAFDGTTFTPIANPSGVQYSFFIGETTDQMYLSFYDNSNFTNFLYLFDGNTFTEIPNPTGFEFSWVVYLDPEGGTSYLNYYDQNFYSFIFELNGSTLTQLPVPTDFQFPFYINRFDGRDFFGMYDINFNQFLFSYDGTDFVEVDAPAGYTFTQYADTLGGDAYYAYYDLNFINHLTKLEPGSNSVLEVTGPADFTYASFGASANDKLFLGYNNNNFQQTLFIYDGNEFTEVENPLGKAYSFTMTEDQGFLYLRYNDLNFYQGTLYKLRPNSIPTSADNSVTTFINVPYFFKQNDFSFADTDGSDTLSSIMITEVETVGNLFLDGAHVYVGDIILVEDLSNLVFFPNTGDEALNYDSFSFRVSDGDDFSDEEYVMTINVIDEATSTEENFLDANILLYPVPADQFTTLQINATQAIETLNVRIVSMNGQVVLQQSFNQIGEEFQYQFDLTNLVSGQYILHGISPNGMVAKGISVER